MTNSAEFSIFRRTKLTQPVLIPFELDEGYRIPPHQITELVNHVSSRAKWLKLAQERVQNEPLRVWIYSNMDGDDFCDSRIRARSCHHEIEAVTAWLVTDAVSGQAVFQASVYDGENLLRVSLYKPGTWIKYLQEIAIRDKH